MSSEVESKPDGLFDCLVGSGATTTNTNANSLLQVPIGESNYKSNRNSSENDADSTPPAYINSAINGGLDVQVYDLNQNSSYLLEQSENEDKVPDKEPALI